MKEFKGFGQPQTYARQKHRGAPHIGIRSCYLQRGALPVIGYDVIPFYMEIAQKSKYRATFTVLCKSLSAQELEQVDIL